MTALLGYTTGVFDLFHVGHLRLLTAARERCDQLVVGVATDEMAATSKGISPAIPFEDRCAIVSAIKGVSRVIPHRKIDDLADWEALRYNKLFKGSDWQGHPRFVELSAEFAARSIEVVFLPYTSHVSTTLLRGHLAGPRTTREGAGKSDSGVTTASIANGVSIAGS